MSAADAQLLAFARSTTIGTVRTVHGSLAQASAERLANRGLMLRHEKVALEAADYWTLTDKGRKEVEE